MKAETVKTKNKDNGIDMLARLVKTGFDKVDKRFEQMDKRFEQMDNRFEQVDKRFVALEENVSYVKKEVVAINLAQDETNRRLTSIERKQTGILSSLDETVTRSEFRLLANKVAVLEKKR